MQTVLAHIANKKNDFDAKPFFSFMRDGNVPILQRMAFAPCWAHHALSFADLNRYYLTDESSDDVYQKMLNHHAAEDGTHWAWYLTDLERLGLNPELGFTDAMRMVWSKETAATRLFSYKLIEVAIRSSQLMKLVMVETIEAIGNSILLGSVPLINELSKSTKLKYPYYGEHHLERETGHMNLDGTDFPRVEEIVLSEGQREQAIALVDEIFQSAMKCFDEMLIYAKARVSETPGEANVVATRRDLSASPSSLG
jgi:hypothetical protein